MRRTKAEAQDTRCSILDAAEAEFYDNGVSRTTLAGIAEAASVTRGAIYFHFRNKNALFVEMHERGRLPQEYFVRLMEAVGAEDPIRHLRGCCVEALEYIATNDKVQRILTIMLLRCEYVGEMEDALIRIRDADEVMIATIRDALQGAADKGLLDRRWTAESATQALHCTMGGLITEWLRSNRGFDLRAVGEGLVGALIADLNRADAAIDA